MAGENGEVVQLALFGRRGRSPRPPGRWSRSRRRGKRPWRRVVGGEGQGVERGVNDGYAGSVGLRVLEGTPVRAGNAHQVAEGGDDDVRLFGELEEGGDFAVVGHADRAAGPVRWVTCSGRSVRRPPLKMDTVWVPQTSINRMGRSRRSSRRRSRAWQSSGSCSVGVGMVFSGAKRLGPDGASGGAGAGITIGVPPVVACFRCSIKA